MVPHIIGWVCISWVSNILFLKPTLHTQTTVTFMKAKAAVWILTMQNAIWFSRKFSCHTTGDLYNGAVVKVEVWLDLRIPIVLLEVNDSQLPTLTLLGPHLISVLDIVQSATVALMMSWSCQMFLLMIISNLVYGCKNVHFLTVTNIKVPLTHHIQHVQ